jgi:excisionase family DNA binding protein
MRKQININPNHLYTVSELALALHVHKSTVRRLLQKGSLEYIQPSPRKRFIKGEDVVKYLITTKGGIK